MSSNMALIATTDEGQEAYAVLDQVNDGTIGAASGVEQINAIYDRTEPGTKAWQEVRDAGGIAERIASATMSSDSITGQAGL
jgi:hypothetical protein